jgi:hypothetical protein
LQVVAPDVSLDPHERLMCVECAGNEFLCNHIEQAGEQATCSYCGNEASCISIDEFANQIEAVFEDYFEVTASQPDAYESLMMGDKESDYEWQRKGEPTVNIIAGIANVDEAIAADAQKVLKERHGNYYDQSDCDPFGDETHCEMKQAYSGKFPVLWFELERSPVTETRLFNRGAQAIMEQVFAGIAGHTTLD